MRLQLLHPYTVARVVMSVQAVSTQRIRTTSLLLVAVTRTYRNVWASGLQQWSTEPFSTVYHAIERRKQESKPKVVCVCVCACSCTHSAEAFACPPNAKPENFSSTLCPLSTHCSTQNSTPTKDASEIHKRIDEWTNRNIDEVGLCGCWAPGSTQMQSTGTLYCKGARAMRGTLPTRNRGSRFFLDAASKVG